MGKTQEEPVIDERVKAARARLERLKKEQGVPEFDIDRLMQLALKPGEDDETPEEFAAFLRELRTQGSPRP